MNSALPDNLIFQDASLKVSYRENCRANRTKDSIIIEGTRGGFLSLANALLYYFNDLDDLLEVHSLPFVSSDIKFNIGCDYSSTAKPHGIIERVGNNSFAWSLTESASCEIASAIHSLGHINNELHLDEGKSSEEVSVYCVVW